MDAWSSSGPTRSAQTSDPHRAGPDQRALPTEASRNDPGTAAERELRMFAKRLLGRVEERWPGPAGNRPTNDRQIEVEQVAHRGHRLADEATGALHDLVGRLG